MPQLLPCPFCGSEAIFERRGTNRQSCIVVCVECGCRHESGDEEGWNGSSWNDRFQPKTEPGDELGALWRAIVLNSKGDLFWIGEILLAELEKETGYKPNGRSAVPSPDDDHPALRRKENEMKEAPLPWTFTANSWQYTTIYDGNGDAICRLDLEDWGVTEDNQYDLEKMQAKVAALIIQAVNKSGGLDTAAQGE